MSTVARSARRRAMVIPGLVALAFVLTVALPLWLPLAVVVDLVRGRTRFPLARLLSFALCWAWLEVAGVSAAFVLWLVRQTHNERAHYALQRWWSARLMAALRITCGISVEVDDVGAFEPGPVLLFVRHASLADALVTAHVVVSLAGMRPRFVLKRELLADPCLDIVGHRLPNHFLDRDAADSAPELAAIERLVHDLGPRDVGVIFPEGTRANPAKRESALRRIAERDAARAARLSVLQVLLPPRPSGAQAMVRGTPDTDVVIAWHVGFDGLDTFGGALRALNRPFPPVRFVARRVPAAEVPLGEGFAAWLDGQWLGIDGEVADAIAQRARSQARGSQDRG